MKSFLKIVVLFLVLTVVSCTKQQIDPINNNTDSSTASPVWRSASVVGTGSVIDGNTAGIIDPNDRGSEGTDTVDGVHGGTSDPIGSDIVDPNDRD